MFAPMNPISDLYLAASTGDAKRVKELLKSGIDPNTPSKDGKNALQIAAEKGKKEIVALLLEAKANVNGLDPPPLFLAATYGHVDVVKLLLAHNADPNEVTNDKKTAVIAAACANEPDVIKALAEAKANLDFLSNGGNSPLHLAVYAGNVEATKALLENKALPDVINQKNETPLLVCNDETIMKLLLQYKADPNAQDEEGITALHNSVVRGNIEQVKILLEDKRTNPNLADNFGTTPLHLASAGEEPEDDIIKELLKRGADPEKRDNTGSSSLDLIYDQAPSQGNNPPGIPGRSLRTINLFTDYQDKKNKNQDLNFNDDEEVSSRKKMKPEST